LAAFAKLKAVILCLAKEGVISGQSKEECLLKLRCLIYLSDLECYRRLGRPLLPEGFFWWKASDGPELGFRNPLTRRRSNNR
jgi:hypothetical protein